MVLKITNLINTLIERVKGMRDEIVEAAKNARFYKKAKAIQDAKQNIMLNSDKMGVFLAKVYPLIVQGNS